MSLAGKTVAFTGEMVGMTRKEASAIAQAAGAMIGSATSKNIDFLFAGNGATPAKTMAAQQNGVQVMAAPQFSAMTAGVQAMPTPMKAAPKKKLAMPQQYQVPVPMQQQPVAVQEPAMTTEVPAYEAPATGTMPWETEVVGETAPMAMKKTRAPKMAVATPAPAMPAAPAMQQYQAPVQQATAQPSFDNKAVTLPGKSLTFTGSLETATRAEAGAMANQAGATVHTAITPSTDYLVCGANPGQTKVIASQAAGVRNITEAQFMKAASPAVNAMPEAPVYQAPAPVMQQYQQYQAPAPVAAAPRGRKPRMAAPAMPVAPAPVAVQEPAMTTEVPAYEAPATGTMPWETEVVGETAPMAMKKTRAPRAPKMAMATPAPTPAMPVQQAAPVAQTGAISLAGQNVVFTGSLQVNRVVAATMVEKAGGFSQSALSAKTNLLVCGANAGEKMAKAQSMGIRTITEAEFVAACRF